MLHLNQLPYRHIFVHLDGATYGPQSFSGEIGKKLRKVNDRDIVEFTSIDVKLPNIDLNDLSKDQKYLYQIAQSVKKGVVNNSLQSSEPGILNHARCLTGES